MEIKSIKQIKQIGTFSDFSNGGSKRFEKLTFLYGLNASGKTTLCDIFQSISENNNMFIKNRKTIPNSILSQFVEMSVKIGESEQTIKFQNDQWNNNIGKNMSIFGTNFIHKNVFTGLNIERQNKENFTDFVLGEKDVNKAIELKEINQKLRTSNLKNALPLFAKDKLDYEIESFFNLIVIESIESLKEDYANKNTELLKERENQKNKDQILSKAELSIFKDSNIKNILICIRYVNKVLLTSFQSIKEQAIVKLNSHIRSCFDDTEKAEKWIREGLEISNDNLENSLCPFCGQPLINSKDLIETYQSYFDIEYSKFINKIQSDLDLSLQKLRIKRFEFSKYLSDILLITKDYQNLINKPEFNNKIQTFIIIQEKISETEEILKSELLNIINSLDKLIENKKIKPHMKSDIIDYSQIKSQLIEFVENEYKIMELHSYFKNEIESYKSEFRTNQRIEYIQKLEIILDSVEKKIKRIEQDSQCIAYNDLKDVIIKLKEKKIKLNEEIENSQSEFLSNYFDETNDLFKQLGSNNFSLIKDIDNRGNKKVYSLTVKFKNQKIKNDQLSVVFSESDRRALALSIFLSKINTFDEQSLKDMIIIFDDPMTSFDDNRITKTITLFKSILHKVNQIIILTHYHIFIERFLEISKRQSINYKLLSISLEQNSSEICEIDEKEFISDEHYQKFTNLYNFAKRIHSNNIKSDLRPYLENQLKRIFCKQIIDFDINNNNLETFINDLSENNVITDVQKDKLNEFRQILNPDSHIFTTNNVEDVRDFAQEMLEYLHSNIFVDNTS